MKVEIITISNELLMGEILDTNTAYVSQSLREMNAVVTCKIFVGNDFDIVVDAFRVALRRADVVLVIGGVGPELDDIAQYAAAKAVGRKILTETPGIEGAQLLGGTEESSNGFLIKLEQKALICLPGERQKIGYLLETEALPYLQQQLPPVDVKMGWTLLRTTGIMESSLKMLLADLPFDDRHRITFDSHAGQTNMRLWVESDSEERVESELELLKQQILDRLGDQVFGAEDDRLEDVVMHSLEERGYNLALAECYTGQSTAKLLAHVKMQDGAVHILPVTSWPELQEILKLEDLTPDNDFETWCRESTEKLRVQSGTDLGLLIYKIINQGGIQLVVALASEKGVELSQRSFGGHPENINQWAATLALTHLRRWLLVHQ